MASAQIYWINSHSFSCNIQLQSFLSCLLDFSSYFTPEHPISGPSLLDSGRFLFLYAKTSNFRTFSAHFWTFSLSLCQNIQFQLLLCCLLDVSSHFPPKHPISSFCSFTVLFPRLRS